MVKKKIFMSILAIMFVITVFSAWVEEFDTCSDCMIDDKAQLPEFKLNPQHINVARINNSEHYRIPVDPSTHRLEKVIFPSWISKHGHAEVGKGIVGLKRTPIRLSRGLLTQFFSHRGNHKNAPENSLPAFEQVKYLGVETDIRLTLDKKWIIMHDETIDRMTNGKGRVEQLTLDQIKAYRFNTGNGIKGYSADQLRVPTLEEYLKVCKNNNIVPVIEIKMKTASEAEYQQVAAAVRAYKLTNVKIISFFLEPLKAMKRLLPKSDFLYLTGDINQTTIEQAKSIGTHSGLNIAWTNVTPEKVKAAKDLGLTVGAWTVPSSKFEEMKRAGVDYITTDY